MSWALVQGCDLPFTIVVSRTTVLVKRLELRCSDAVGFRFWWVFTMMFGVGLVVVWLVVRWLGACLVDVPCMVYGTGFVLLGADLFKSLSGWSMWLSFNCSGWG